MSIRRKILIKQSKIISKECLLVLSLVAFSCQSVPAFALSDPNWDQLQSRGSSAFYKCEYGNAERILKQAEVTARAFGPADMRLAKSAGELGRLLAIRGRFVEAEPYLEEALRANELTHEDRGQIIPAMGSLVRFYLTGGTAEKAEPLTEEVLSVVEGTLRGANPQAQSKVKYQKGQPLQGWAGEAAPVMRDPLIEWAITCDELGNLYVTRGNFDMAERLFKAALDVKTTVLGKQHLSLANSYDSLGSLCLARNDIAEAETYFKDSLEMTEKIQPPEHPQVYARLDKLAKCLIKEGKYKQAEELYLRAKDFWKASPTPNANQPRALYSLGSVYVDEKEYSLAAPMLEQALQLSEQINGVYSVALVPYLERYAYDLYYLGRKEEMEQLRARATSLSSPAVQNDVAAEQGMTY